MEYIETMYDRPLVFILKSAKFSYRYYVNILTYRMVRIFPTVVFAVMDKDIYEAFSACRKCIRNGLICNI